MSFNMCMLEQVNLTVFIIAVTLGTISECHIRIGYIGFSANGTFMSCNRFRSGSTRSCRRSSPSSGTHILSHTVISVELVFSVYLFGGNSYSFDISNIKDQTVYKSRHNGKSCIRTSHDKHISQIYDIENPQPLHLYRDQEIKPDDIIGISHGKYDIYGNINEISAESKPDITAENISGFLICLNNRWSVGQIKKSKICKGKKHSQKDSCEDKQIISVCSPGPFKDITYGVAAPEHQQHEKDIAAVGRNYKPGKKPPYLPVYDLIGIESQIIKEAVIDHFYDISHRIAYNEP